MNMDDDFNVWLITWPNGDQTIAGGSEDSVQRCVDEIGFVQHPSKANHSSNDCGVMVQILTGEMTDAGEPWFVDFKGAKPVGWEDFSESIFNNKDELVGLEAQILVNADK